MDTHAHARTLSGRLRFPPSPASNPLPSSSSRKKIFIQEGALLFSRLRLLFRHGRRERCVPVCVCVRERNTHKVKSLRTRHLQPSLLHPSFTSRIQKALLCRGESPNLVVKLSAAGRERERKQQQCPNFVVLFSRLTYKMASFKQETVRMKGS